MVGVAATQTNAFYVLVVTVVLAWGGIGRVGAWAWIGLQHSSGLASGGTARGRRRRLTVIGWVAHVRGRSGWSGTTSAAMLSRGRMGILKTGRQWKPR